MNASDVMTQHVISTRPDASVLEAAQLMLSHRISGLPVLDAGRVVGMVTEGDLLRRVETGTTVRKRARWIEFILGPGKLADEYVRSHSRRVEDVMTPNPEVVQESTPIDAIVVLMEQKRIKRLPVVRGEELVGILSRADLVRALATVAHKLGDTAIEDKEVRARVLAELGKQPWYSAVSINITVSEGVVEVWGTIFEEKQRRAIRVAVENTPGVRKVIEHLVWVEPISGIFVEASNLRATGQDGTC